MVRLAGPSSSMTLFWLLCFNSSMVRLAVSLFFWTLKIEASFNSSMVRLAGAFSQPQLNHWPKFQFQYGTISGWVQGHLMSWRVIRFNSSMVRLAATQSPDEEAQTILFQFQYGTISGYTMNPEFQGLGCFNSSMVRLAGSLYLQSEDRDKVSIPVWYD